MRVSKIQKQSLMLLHFMELKYGLYISVNSSYLRKAVGQTLEKEIASNHFLVSMHTLAKNGYLEYQANDGHQLHSTAKENENMWQLTVEGRQYAETHHSAQLRIKRIYRKSKTSL
ncbi:hypothetical protein [Vibrio algicola]|uniref:hypothetical protein n=1 Tax=Vibrio algicola TaxID=2662262 RepID=UPI0015B3F2E6|nr:hypothetical protein [Vibrio algicola]